MSAPSENIYHLNPKSHLECYNLHTDEGNTLAYYELLPSSLTLSLSNNFTFAAKEYLTML